MLKKIHRVGILGAGQLGCMLLESLQRLGVTVAFYDPDSNAPGFERTPHSVCGSWTDRQKLTTFFASCDVVTYEFENVSTDLLNDLVEQTQVPLWPGSQALKTTQNRLLEKKFLHDQSLPVVYFETILPHQNPWEKLQQIPFPCVVKTVSGGYDGKGQWVLRNLDTLSSLPPDTFPAGQTLVVEELISLVAELSCIVARNQKGETICFPIFTNTHKNNILDTTVLPSQISPQMEKAIIDISVKAAQELGIIGLLTTEFFVANQPSYGNTGLAVDGQWLFVNEFAPRPHNSGHITREACTLSQFDAQALILLGYPLPQPALRPGAYCMGNLLGADVALASQRGLCPDILGVTVYGKKEVKPNRKMGHFVTYGETPQAALAVAKKFLQSTPIEPSAR